MQLGCHIYTRVVLCVGNAGDSRQSITTFTPSPQVPAVQFFEKVEPGSVADKAGIKAGDFVLEVWLNTAFDGTFFIMMF
jgi:hypothetical protein